MGRSRRVAGAKSACPGRGGFHPGHACGFAPATQGHGQTKMIRDLNEENPVGRSRILRLGLLSLVAIGAGPGLARAAAADLKDEALRALKTAATFYPERVASHGGYVYYSSEDLRRRWGEGETSPGTIFVQPPGTPTVGMAY